VTQSPDNPLWDFSLSVYSERGVAEECLTLQDRHDLNVNLVLLAAYLGCAGIALTEEHWEDAASEIALLDEIVVRPLRSIRRALKSHANTEDSLGTRPMGVYRTIKAAEIDAERLEQDVLYRWAEAPSTGSAPVDVRSLIAENTATLLRATGRNSATFAMPSRLIEVASEWQRRSGGRSRKGV
jgi:uncharacterized protein (TIGR02444 family)